MMLQMKLDYDWPAGLRDIHVWKCERTDGRWLESHPKMLTLSLRLWWAKKKENLTRQQGMNDCCADNYLAYNFFVKDFSLF